MPAHTIYIAGSYAAREQLQARAQQLMTRGISVTSNWLWWNPPDILLDDNDKLNATIWHLATHNLLDAEAVVIDTSVESTKGSFHVELGLALSLMKPIIIVGPRPNAFYYMTHIFQYDTWDAFIEEFDKAIVDLTKDDFAHRLRRREMPDMSSSDILQGVQEFLSQQQQKPPNEDEAKGL